MRYLTIALTKGRLAKKTLELLEKTGITCEEMKDPASRKLIFTDEEHKLKFFLAKGPDVPTYVEYGAADIGIVGEDTILEEQRKIYEVLDLGFGKCRMCVCGPKENEELLKHQEFIRVATKYPNITRAHYAKTGTQVEIVKLHGNIELAPLTGMAERIVDITATGTTLKENDLVVVDEVLSSTARFFSNTCAFRTDARIVQLANTLQRNAEASASPAGEEKE